MKFAWVLAIGALVLSAPVFASKELAQKNGCFACHAVDKKKVGPAYQDVAKKYANEKEAEITLVNNIRSGGQGKWGPVPMPPQSTVSEADLKALAKWILAGAK
jgi:cytochrome c